MLCRHIGQEPVGERVEGAVERVLREKRSLTPDLGGTASTDAFTDAVIAALAS
jgi:isocitrate/isopropylmalate dehydrogenase